MGITLHPHLPASAFPWNHLGPEPTQEAFRRYIAGWFRPEPAVWYQAVCGVCIVVLGLAVVTAAVLLAKRLHEGSLWVFRIEGGVVIPNTLVSFLILLGLYGILLVVWLGLQFGILVSHTVSPSVNPFFQLWIWGFMLLGGWCADWGTMRAIPSDIIMPGSRQRGIRHWTWARSNTVFLGMPLVASVPIIATSIPAIRTWRRAVSAWHAFDVSFREVDALRLATPEQIAWGIRVWQEDVYAQYFLCVCRWVWAAIALLNFFAFAGLGGALILSLREHIQERLQGLSEAGAAQQFTTSLAQDEANRKQQFFPPLKMPPTKPKTRAEELKQAVRNLQLQYFATQGVTAAAAAIAILNATTTQDRTVQGPNQYALIYQVSWATIAIASTLGGVLILLAVFNRELSEPVIFHWRKVAVSESHDETSSRSAAMVKQTRHASALTPLALRSATPLSPRRRSSSLQPLSPTYAEDRDIPLVRVGKQESISVDVWGSVSMRKDDVALSGRHDTGSSHDGDSRPNTGAAHSINTGEGAALCEKSLDLSSEDAGHHRSRDGSTVMSRAI